jgi:uncharacterized protein YndB with AHSA1/START domain
VTQTATTPRQQKPSRQAQQAQALEICKEIVIDAPPDVVWESVLEEAGPAGTHGDGSPMPMVLELFPGGRWFRDLGHGVGHLWGHVQVVKPPGLLELCGPMFMSYPAVNHVQYRLTAEGERTRLKLAHRGFGLIDPEHAKGADQGWGEVVGQIREIAARRVRERAARG